MDSPARPAVFLGWGAEEELIWERGELGEGTGSGGLREGKCCQDTMYERRIKV